MKLSILFIFLLISNVGFAQENEIDLNNKEIAVNEPTDTILALDENIFWGLIEASIRNANNLYDQTQYLTNAIGTLDIKTQVGFDIQSQILVNKAYNNNLWAAAYIMNNGCSDDCFEFFRYWLVGRGKKAFYTALENPDVLTQYIDEEMHVYEYVDLQKLGERALSIKYPELDYDHLNKEPIKDPEKILLTWDEDENKLKDICPRLFKIFYQ